MSAFGVTRIAILLPNVVSPAPQISAQMLGCTHHFGGGSGRRTAQCLKDPMTSDNDRLTVARDW
jgi:hypothetical protein